VLRIRRRLAVHRDGLGGNGHFDRDAFFECILLAAERHRRLHSRAADAGGGDLEPDFRACSRANLNDPARVARHLEHRRIETPHGDDSRTGFFELARDDRTEVRLVAARHESRPFVGSSIRLSRASGLPF
jgi:hypothetical protein